MQRLNLALLGSPQITHAQLGQIALPNRKALALLTYLTVEAPAAQSRETLLGLLWPELPDVEARNNLRVTWAWLRQRLGDDNPGVPPLLHSTRLDLQLNPNVEVWFDLREFNALVRACEQHQHPQRDQCAACQERLAQAAALYRGEFLAGFALDGCPEFEAWVFVQRERAHVQVLKLLEELAHFHETHGQPSQAEAYTRQQLALDSLQEAAHRRLMRLLHQQGRRAAALAQFATCRDVLAAELGIEPETETAVLYAQLKTHIPPAVSSTPWPAATSTLPEYLTPFIGRETELAAIGGRLRAGRERLITLVGPGGIGKTRLAQQLAAEYGSAFRDGAYFVPLAQIPTVESIPAAIVEALGLSFVASQRSSVEQLIEMLSGRQILLVLDNFEHLIDGATLLLRLVQAAPQLVLLVTTRERLNLQAEDLFELDGLPTPASNLEDAADQFAAIRLFLDRAQRLSKRLPVSAAQLPEIVQICQLVEGFPLAIELAATWTRDLTCQEIVAELSGGLNQLETTLRDIAPHHRSLRAVFDASWRLLSNAEQRALLLLAVFQGGFSRDAAHAIAGVAAPLLSGLRDKSLLRPAGARRYDMHAVVQQFAAEALTANPQAADRAYRDHSRYFLTILAAQAVALDTRAARTAADAIQPDWENVSRAWQWAAQSGDYDLLESALDGLVRFGNLRGLFQEAQTALERALLRPSSGACEPAPAHLHCRLLTARAYMAGRRGMEQTLTLAQQALALAEQLEDSPAIIENLIIQSNAYNHIADFVQARALAERALGLAQAEGLEVSIGMCLHSLGVIDYLTSEFEQASPRFQQVLAIHERTGRLEQFGREAVGRLGIIASEEGHHDTALQYLQDYLASCERMGDRRNIVHAQHHLAFVWLKLGEYGRVMQMIEQNIPHARALGDGELVSLGLHVQAWAQRALGQLDAALSSATESVEMARASQARLALAFALQQVAETELERAVDERDWAQAADRFQEAAASFRAIDKTHIAYEAEIGLAELHRRRGTLAAAIELIEPIVPRLPTTTANGWDNPLRAYVVCVRILRAAHDPAAELILDQGLQFLDASAQNVGDQRLRRSFLQAIAAHHELRALRAAGMV
jgi:predicted ATPase/DNA-binding SARP family transcriptional activator